MIDKMEDEKVKCYNCSESIPKKWTLEFNNDIICEECYIDDKHQVRIYHK